jgi:hypothetical protein
MAVGMTMVGTGGTAATTGMVVVTDGMAAVVMVGLEATVVRVTTDTDSTSWAKMRG